MTLVKGTTKLAGLIVMLSSATVGAAADRSHPAVAAGAVCATRQCHAPLHDSGSGPRDRSRHQPVADGECEACHDLALPVKTGFVKGAPAGGDDNSEKAGAWDLVLCSGCHEDLLAAKDPASGATRFAAGNRNLHTLHVQAGRGRRCLTCHAPHVSRQPRLLREQIPTRGSARIAQQFRGEPKGGWCKTGCHAPKSYRR